MIPYSAGALSNATYGSSVWNQRIGAGDANQLAVGMGNIVGRVFEDIASTYRSVVRWWYREPTGVKVQRKIFKNRVSEAVKQLDFGFTNIRKNPNDAGAFNRIIKIADDYKTCFEPHEKEKFKEFQVGQFKQLETKISTLQSHVVEKLRPILPMVFQNIKRAKTEPNPKIDPQRVKETSSRKKNPRRKQKKGTEKASIPHSKASEEKKGGKAPLKLNLVEDSRAAEARSATQSRQASACTLSFDLNSPDPTKFFKLSSPLSQPNAGFTIARIGLVNGKETFAIADSAATTSGAVEGAGKVWFIYGGTDVSSVNLQNLLSSQGFVIEGVNPFDRLGYSIAGLGDFKQNGSNAVALGAPNNGGGESHLYMLFGPLQNPVDLSNCDGSKCSVVKGSISDNLGFCTAGGEDISGDNVPDLLVGAPGAQQFFGIFGGPGPWPSQFNTSQLTGSNGFVGQGAAASNLGCPLAMGKTEKNNPIAGFAVGAQTESPLGRTNAGSVYVFNGRNGTWPAQLNFAIDGTPNGFSAYGQPFDFVPNGLSIGSDFDNDGEPDMLVTTNNAKLYDIFRQPSPVNTPLSLGALNGTNGGIALQGAQPTNGNWPKVVTIDINGDGFLDVAIGMPDYSPSAGLNKAGGILFILGQVAGLPPGFDLTNSSSVLLVPGVANGAGLGKDLANLGDVDGDGRPDLGATSSNSGDVYVLLGQPFPLVCPTTLAPTTTSSPTSIPPTSAPTTSAPSPTNIGPIVGGVVAGVIVVGGVATLVFLRVFKKGCFAEDELPNRNDDDSIFNV